MKIYGTVTEFFKIAENGNEGLQGFCGKCGSHLYASDPAKTLFMVRTGCRRGSKWRYDIIQKGIALLNDVMLIGD